jgi:hypothetical protein
MAWHRPTTPAYNSQHETAAFGVASRQRRFGSAADSRDLGVGHTDWPPERFPAADSIGVPRGALLGEGQDSVPELVADRRRQSRLATAGEAGGLATC